MTNEEYINQHPEQFKDDIDKWLFTEFVIIGGCCSAEKCHEYSVARMVAEKLTDAFIEKACEFMETYPHMFMGVMRTEMIEDFKKAMEE